MTKYHPQHAKEGRIGRCLRLAYLLTVAPPRGLTVADLLIGTGASKATLYRDFDLLRAVGWPVEQCEAPGTEARYRIRLVTAAR